MYEWAPNKFSVLDASRKKPPVQKVNPKLTAPPQVKDAVVNPKLTEPSPVKVTVAKTEIAGNRTRRLNEHVKIQTGTTKKTILRNNNRNKPTTQKRPVIKTEEGRSKPGNIAESTSSSASIPALRISRSSAPGWKNVEEEKEGINISPLDSTQFPKLGADSLESNEESSEIDPVDKISQKEEVNSALNPNAAVFHSSNAPLDKCVPAIDTKQCPPRILERPKFTPKLPVFSSSASSLESSLVVEKRPSVELEAYLYANSQFESRKEMRKMRGNVIKELNELVVEWVRRVSVSNGNLTKRHVAVGLVFIRLVRITWESTVRMLISMLW